MNIWIDISNAPHVIFFKGFIKEWQEQGHNTIVTARDLSGSLELLRAHNIEFTEIGNHYGASKLQKLKGLFIRCLQLRKFLSNKSIDVAMSQSSFYSPIVAKMLKVRCVYTNDNEYAKGNIIAHLFASHVIYPKCMEPIVSYSRFKSKFSYYTGTKEGIYLSQMAFDKKIVNRDIRIAIRPEPWTAQYHKRDDTALISLIENLTNHAKVSILPRDNKQKDFFKSLGFNHVSVIEKPLSLQEIFDGFDFFLGAGGSMSRELAVLGLPCLSMYQGELLSVDESLISAGVLVHDKEPTADLVKQLLAKSKESSNGELLSNILQQGKEARKHIHNAVVLSN